MIKTIRELTLDSVELRELCKRDIPLSIKEN